MRRPAIAALASGCALFILTACGEKSEPAVSAPEPPEVSEPTAAPPAEPPPEDNTAEEIAALRPPIEQMRIPFPQKRKDEMVDYSERHYGISSYELKDPQVIVEHYSVTSDAQSVYNTFAADAPDAELGELPGLCSHFVIDTDGTIIQLVPLSLMCRHTVGLNYTSFGVEHVGMSDADIMNNPAQLNASLELSRWLRCAYGIRLENVIGHNENTSSPFHMERVAALQDQTHGDFTPATMEVYRRKLEALPCPE